MNGHFFEDADQIVEGGDDKAKAEEGVSCEPGKEERAEGEEEPEEKQEGGCQRNLGGKLTQQLMLLGNKTVRS